MGDVKTPTHEEIEALRPERLSTVGEARGWNVGYAAGWVDGHATGVEEGAREAFEWLFDEGLIIDSKSHDSPMRSIQVDFARFLASRPATGTDKVKP